MNSGIFLSFEKYLVKSLIPLRLHHLHLKLGGEFGDPITLT
jgi:hypothetical protein